MSAFNGKKKVCSPLKAPTRLIIDHRRKLSGLKRIIKDLVLENAYLCDEVAQVHEETLILKEEVRSLLKRLHQLEASAGIESTLQPTSFSTHEGQTSSPAPKKALKRKTPHDEEVNGNTTSQIYKPKVSGKNKAIKEEHFDS
ncbi:Transforming growth factor beta regulator 1 [Frankliniella fusca]|uniref:Transforming growth factor beta regulator 1 n=1 Tax=Frankliniella fusca TaxID=407009 RepID=A0AAE1LVA4_9NEOP|nr:Transforming growth factor beta regulator 1 [Frankliniella fusca]